MMAPIVWRVSSRVTSYAWAVQTMVAYARQVAMGQAPQAIWLMRHTPVYAVGKMSQAHWPLDDGTRHARPLMNHSYGTAQPETRFCPAVESKLQPAYFPHVSWAHQEIPVVFAPRGGHITYHDPGQQMVYLILQVKRYGGAGAVVDRVQTWAQACADVLTKNTVFSRNVQGLAPGIWIQPRGGSVRKVGSMGMHIAQGVTHHGFCLNVGTNLRFFESIMPCELCPDVMDNLLSVGMKGSPQDARRMWHTVQKVLWHLCPWRRALCRRPWR